MGVWCIHCAYMVHVRSLASTRDRAACSVLVACMWPQVAQQCCSYGDDVKLCLCSMYSGMVARAAWPPEAMLLPCSRVWARMSEVVCYSIVRGESRMGAVHAVCRSAAQGCGSGLQHLSIMKPERVVMSPDLHRAEMVERGKR